MTGEKRGGGFNESRHNEFASLLIMLINNILQAAVYLDWVYMPEIYYNVNNILQFIVYL